MGAGHAHTLYVHEHSPVHRLPSETKVAATLLFAVGVAATPREALGAFAVDAVVLVLVARVARVPGRFVLVRLLVVAPFVLLALAFPFVGGGDRLTLVGVEVSREGTLAAVNIIAKATLGATASILLAATTEVTAVLRGFERLHAPPILTAIAAFMIRYLEVLAAELGRTRTAMAARGHDPRWIWQLGPLASSAGSLFVRAYERGERVHEAMLSRGFTGRMPDLGHPRAKAGDWLAVAPVPVIAVTMAVAGAVLT